MKPDRRMRLWSQVVEQASGDRVGVEHVAATTKLACAVDGVAVAVKLAASPRETVYTSDPVIAAVEEITVVLGEGPGVDALAGDLTLVPDLTAAECLSRWPMFAPAAAELGVRSMFALPLRVGGIGLGVMEMWRARAGALERGKLADALLLADTACALLLDQDRPHEPDAIGRPPEHAGLQHPEVHQATGMITVQLGVTAAVALMRLRAHAFTHDRRLSDVARDVVARRLRFRPNDGTVHES